MEFSELPLALQMLLNPDIRLSAAILDEWTAACGACFSNALEDDMALPASPARLPGHGGGRRGPKKLVDTHDFFTLSEALDTLTGELKSSTGRGFSPTPPSLAAAAARPSASTSPEIGANASTAASAARGAARLRVDDFDFAVRRDTTPSDAQQQAEIREAAAAFRGAQYKVALDRLLHASSLCMSHELPLSLLNNIAVCYYKLELWDLCVSATQRVMSTDAANAYPSSQRLARVHICQGNSEEAQRLVATHRDAPEWTEEVAAVGAYRAYCSFYASHQYARARESLEAVIAVMPCGTLEATKARVLSLDNALAAARYAQQKAVVYPYSVEVHMAAWELSFHAATSTADLSALLAEMQRATISTSDLRYRLLVTHVSRCRDAVDKLASLTLGKRWAEVVDLATQTLLEAYVSDGVKGMVYHDRARARVQLGASWYEALDDAHRALSYTEKPELRAQLLLLVARIEEALGRWQDAVDHAEESLGLLRSVSTETYLRRLRERRTQEQKKSATSQGHASSPPGGGANQQRQRQQQQQQQHAATDSSRASLDVHYATLALRSGAAVAEVRKSYRAMAMKWHPDRWCGATAAEIQTAETRFKAIQDAYEKLMQGLV